MSEYSEFSEQNASYFYNRFPAKGGGVAPFGNHRIIGLWHLPDEYRRHMRPSSVKTSKVSIIGIMSSTFITNGCEKDALKISYLGRYEISILFSSLVKEPKGTYLPLRKPPLTRGLAQKHNSHALIVNSFIACPEERSDEGWTRSRLNRDDLSP